MDVREVWYGRSASASLIRDLLTPLSWLYAAGWQTYRGLYRSGLKRAAEPHLPVICVGNLLAGGTGKSPMTVYLAGLLQLMGRKVAISASGYGSPHAEAATKAPEGELKASVWGDEPAMLRWLLPEAPLIVGRRRVLAAEICHRDFPDHVLLMDDGFQHLPLRKHVTVLLDPVRPTNRRCLPAGPYREPRSNRRFASTVLPGVFSVFEDKSWLEEPLLGSGENAKLPVSYLVDNRYSVLCALGSPERFLDSLPGRPAKARLLSDHDPLTAGTLFDGLPQGLPVVVTAKDWVKLRDRSDLDKRRILVARHSVRVEPQEAFKRWLEQILDETQATSP